MLTPKPVGTVSVKRQATPYLPDEILEMIIKASAYSGQREAKRRAILMSGAGNLQEYCRLYRPGSPHWLSSRQCNCL